MTICGFGFGKDLVRLNYPVVESVRSVLSVCDRFVYVVGRSDDGTRELVASIDPKVEIFDSDWPNVQMDGTVLSIEANKAMELAQTTGCDWGLYIQADEVVHENDLDKIRAACDYWRSNDQVKSLLFSYLHFVLDYRTTDPWMYHKASRIVRLDGSCRIVGDACGPAIKEYVGKVGNRDGYLDKHFLGTHVQWAERRTPGIIGKRAPARIFHYGWVKTRKELDEKLTMVEELWYGALSGGERQRRMRHLYGRFIERYPILRNYNGSHPAIMANRITRHPAYGHSRNRWTKPSFYAEVLRHGFHG